MNYATYLLHMKYDPLMQVVVLVDNMHLKELSNENNIIYVNIWKNKKKIL